LSAGADVRGGGAVNPFPWFRSIARWAVLLLAAGTMLPAGAVITYFSGSGQRSISLRVGSNNTSVNCVTFNVTGTNVAPNATPVTGTPGCGAPATTPSGGIEFSLTANRRSTSGDVVHLTVDSSAGMSCTGGGCGSTIVPFTTVSWTSQNRDGSMLDIPNGSFTGGASQTILNIANGQGGTDSVTVTNVLIFSYGNATLYPAGSYSGRVTFTATVP
jgi:hypothetical protein